MKFSLILLVSLLVIQKSVAPPVTKEEKENEVDEKEILPPPNIKYHKYLQEVVEVLEKDPEFRAKLEKADREDVLSGKIANELEFASHHVRTQLDELKRKELERLTHLATEEYRLEKGLDIGHLKISEHIDHKNPHTFEIDDLKKLIAQTAKDLDEADRKRKEEFREYEMKKKFEEQERLKKLNKEEKEKYEKEQHELEKKEKEHAPFHHPGSKKQLEEVWEEQDHMEQQFDPRTFFYLHDVDGNNVWDQNEVKALFLNELHKMYPEGDARNDPIEKNEEAERMREHIVKEADLNKDGLISYDEFMLHSQRSEFEKDPEWKRLDEQEIYSEQEYEEFARRRAMEIEAAIAKGMSPEYHPDSHPQAGHEQFPSHPNQVPHQQVQYQHQVPPQQQHYPQQGQQYVNQVPAHQDQYHHQQIPVHEQQQYHPNEINHDPHQNYPAPGQHMPIGQNQVPSQQQFQQPPVGQNVNQIPQQQYHNQQVPQHGVPQHQVPQQQFQNQQVPPQQQYQYQQVPQHQVPQQQFQNQQVPQQHAQYQQQQVPQQHVQYQQQQVPQQHVQYQQQQVPQQNYHQAPDAAVNTHQIPQQNFHPAPDAAANVNQVPHHQTPDAAANVNQVPHHQTPDAAANVNQVPHHQAPDAANANHVPQQNSHQVPDTAASANQVPHNQVNQPADQHAPVANTVNQAPELNHQNQHNQPPVDAAHASNGHNQNQVPQQAHDQVASINNAQEHHIAPNVVGH